MVSAKMLLISKVFRSGHDFLNKASAPIHLVSISIFSQAPSTLVDFVCLSYQSHLPAPVEIFSSSLALPSSGCCPQFFAHAEHVLTFARFPFLNPRPSSPIS